MGGNNYAHIEIVVAFLVVNIFSCLIIASFGVGDMTWEFGEMFSYVSSTFLYLLEANIQAIDLSLFSPNILEFFFTTVIFLAYRMRTVRIEFDLGVDMLHKNLGMQPHLILQAQRYQSGSHNKGAPPLADYPSSSWPLGL